ncbi:MAG: hypothetical protein WBE26_15990, partial [Phycisphaerae bacterium]
MALRKRTVWGLLVAMTMWVPGASAQQPPEKGSAADTASELSTGRAPATATIEAIMEQAVRNIAARYNLNEDQTALTGKLMKRDVYRFLEEHEAEVWPIIRDLLAAQLGAKPPESQEEIKRIGEAAKPLAQLAKEAIFRANEEWRHILTPEQKKLHDFDLAEMETTFEQIDKNFAEWEAGRPPEDGIFPAPQIDGQPLRPHKPQDEKPIKVIFDPNRILETLVEEFIKDYKLDEGQITAARSIRQEFKAKANDFRDSNKLEFAKIARQQQEAIANRDLDAIKKAAAAHKKLLEPVYGLCGQMHERLKGLLTTAQIERYAEKSGSKKEKAKGATVKKKTSPKKEPPPPKSTT